MLARALLDGQASGRRRGLQEACQQHYLASQPALWQEEEITQRAMKSLGGTVDKAFAAAWQDDTHLLVGTKCNRLLQWDTATGGLCEVALPPAPPREGHEVFETMWGSCGIHSVCVNPAGDLVATGGAQPADCAVLRLPDFQPVQTLVGHLDWVFGAAWVSDRHLVTGSRDQSVALWSIPEPGSGAPAAQYKAPGSPGGLLRKFEGKVRDVKYCFESCRLAALSTDGCVKLLDAPRGLRTVRTIKLPHNKELVCLEQRADLLAAGSVGHVAMLDPRRRNAEVACVASPDENQGVRSLQLAGPLLSFGTGRGSLFFYDLRKGAFLPTEAAPAECGHEGPLPIKLPPYNRRAAPLQQLSHNVLPAWQPAAAQQPQPMLQDAPPLQPMLQDAPPPLQQDAPPSQAAAAAPPPVLQDARRQPRRHLQLGAGFVEQNDLFYDHFAGQDIRHACYAHVWDASRTRLFVCGGPLAFGLKGCYLAVWQ